MTLVFFKAMRPYDNTTGYFENYYWKDGVCGPMSIREAQRLSAAMGGRIVTVDLPHIDTFEKFLQALGAENHAALSRDKPANTLKDLAGEMTEDPKESIKSNLEATPPWTRSEDDGVEERPDRPERDQSIPLDVILEMKKEGLQALAKSEGIEIPVYAEQFRQLTDAKHNGKYDYTEHIGANKNGQRILQAYLIYHLSK